MQYSAALKPQENPSNRLQSFEGVMKPLRTLESVKNEMPNQEFHTFQEHIKKFKIGLHNVVEGKSALEKYEGHFTESEDPWKRGQVFNCDKQDIYTGTQSQIYTPVEFLVNEGLNLAPEKSRLSSDLQTLSRKFNGCHIDYKLARFQKNSSKNAAWKSPMEIAKKNWANLAVSRYVLTTVRMSDARRKTVQYMKFIQDNWPENEDKGNELMRRCFESLIRQETQLEEAAHFANLALTVEPASTAATVIDTQRQDFVKFMIERNLEPVGEKLKPPPRLTSIEKKAVMGQLTKAIKKGSKKTYPKNQPNRGGKGKGNRGKGGKPNYWNNNAVYDHSKSHTRDFTPYGKPYGKPPGRGGRGGRGRGRGRGGGRGRGRGRGKGRGNFNQKNSRGRGRQRG